jgi:hypothetical protein
MELTTETQPLIAQAHGIKSGDSEPKTFMPEGKGMPMSKPGGAKASDVASNLRIRGWPSIPSKKNGRSTEYNNDSTPRPNII